MLRRYKLKLVTTSLECAHLTADVPRTPAEAINEADAMAASPLQVESAREAGSLDEGEAALTIEVRALLRKSVSRSGQILPPPQPRVCLLV